MHNFPHFLQHHSLLYTVACNEYLQRRSKQDLTLADKWMNCMRRIIQVAYSTDLSLLLSDMENDRTDERTKRDCQPEDVKANNMKVKLDNKTTSGNQECCMQKIKMKNC